MIYFEDSYRSELGEYELFPVFYLPTWSLHTGMATSKLVVLLSIYQTILQCFWLRDVYVFVLAKQETIKKNDPFPPILEFGS